MSAGASLRPSDAASGGFFDGVIATITSVRFVDAYPNGNRAALLEVTYAPEDGSKPRTELYRAGNIEVMQPSTDGKHLVPETARMHKNVGAVKWISAAIEGGFNEALLQNDISVFVGTKALLHRQQQEGWKDRDGKEVKGSDLLLIKKVLSLPGEGKKAAAPKAAAKKAAPAPAAPAPAAPPATEVAAGDIDGELVGIVSALLADAPDNTIPRNRIGNAVFQAAVKSKNPRRAPLMVLAQKDEFYAAEGRPWAFDGENIIGIPAAEEAA